MRKQKGKWKYELSMALFEGGAVSMFLSVIAGDDWTWTFYAIALFCFIPALGLLSIHVDEESAQCK